ncbi:hypothetical protein [Mucispirillum schaedleri]|nr:hypothetical protein [Mucispirillum schaedleri]
MEHKLRDRLTKKAGKLFNEYLLLFVKILMARLAWLTADYVFQLLGLS